MTYRQLIWQIWEAKCSICEWKMAYDPGRGAPGLPGQETEGAIREQFQSHKCEDFLETVEPS